MLRGEPVAEVFNFNQPVQESNSSDFFAYDDLTAGFAPAVVPEPGTLVLLGTGAVGLLARWRRRTRHALRLGAAGEHRGASRASRLS